MFPRIYYAIMTRMHKVTDTKMKEQIKPNTLASKIFTSKQK